MRKHYLQSVFSPRSVAVICSGDHVALGDQVMRNLQDSGYEGDAYPVCGEGGELAGVRCAAALAEVGKPVELAVIAAAPGRLAGLVRECGEYNVSAVLVLSAGFLESGERGQTLQAEVLETARTCGIELVGPDCLGIVRPGAKFNASSARSPVAAGKVALVTQSGSFCSAILDWADANGFGFSAVASLGVVSDAKLGDVLDYLAQDPQTRSILLYVERIGNARRFLSGLRAAARLKPVVVIKSGRNEAGARAALSHIHAPLGSDAVFDAAIRRAGAVRVITVSQLFAAARILATGARVGGSRLAVITNGGGPGVMAADWAANVGLPLARLSDETVAALSERLPDHWSHSDPVDILGGADGERYRSATELVLRDAGVDGLLVLLTPQVATDPSACAEGVIAGSEGSTKPVLASWMGESLVREGRAMLARAGIPQFMAPEQGVDAFSYLASHRQNQNALLQVPEPLGCQEAPDIYGARLVIEHALAERRQILDSAEARAVLRAFRLPLLPSTTATSAAEALVAAENVGLPVAMKISSPDIQHKSDAGGVRLDIRESRSVHRAFEDLLREVKTNYPEAAIDGVCVEPMVNRPHARELKIRVHRDPVFGPVISLGAAGVAESMSEVQVALPPLNEYLSRELIRRTRALGQLRPVPEANLGELVQVLQRVSEIACEIPQVRELHIDPLLVDEHGVIAVEARLEIGPSECGASPYGHMAIHPYPQGMESHILLADGSDVLVRPIRPEDARSEADFVENLSAQSKYFRFMHGLDRLTPSMLARFTQIDYDREMALVAISPDTEPQRMMAVARYVTNADGSSCEFALTVADEWQARGVGRQLMERLIQVARDRGLNTMMGEVLAQNGKMLRLCRGLGFRSMRSPDDREVVIVTRPL